MQSTDVLESVGRLEGDSIRYWIDGGWGVDALLEEETRPHDDLDLVIARVQSGQAQAALSELGSAHARGIVPGLPARIVLRDKQDRHMDLHPVVLDPAENGWQELDGKAWGLYPAADSRAKASLAASACHGLRQNSSSVIILAMPGVNTTDTTWSYLQTGLECLCHRSREQSTRVVCDAKQGAAADVQPRVPIGAG